MPTFPSNSLAGGDDLTGDPRNPFATRFTRPGQVPYFFRPAESLASLQASWSDANRVGQVVGPHGSGKTTLLAAWGGHLEELAVPVHRILVTAAHPLPPHHEMAPWSAIGPESVVLVDGYERFPPFRRWRLKRAIRKQGAGLLVSCHRPMGFSWTYYPPHDLAHLQAIVRWLQRNCHPLIDDRDVAQSFTGCGGNLRETLFALYDLYRIRSLPGPPSSQPDR